MKKFKIYSIWLNPKTGKTEKFNFYLEKVKAKVTELEAKGYQYLGSIGKTEK